MSEPFNEAFGKVFRMIYTKPNQMGFPGKDGGGLCDFFDEEIVLQKHKKLRDDKAAGADELVQRFFKID